jgi:hypothetical protein
MDVFDNKGENVWLTFEEKEMQMVMHNMLKKLLR